MSASIAIGMVSESLRDMLEGEMQLVPAVSVTLLALDETPAAGQDNRINLFLYKVQESPYQRNMDWQVSPQDTTRLQATPLTLNLYYLLTPFAMNDPVTGNSSAHAFLGEAMRVLHEMPVVPNPYLAAGLAGAREQIKISQGTVDMEELTKIWSSCAQHFRLSVPYEVSVVQIDQSPPTQRLIPPRVTALGVPLVSAPYLPPRIDGIQPENGPAGTQVTVSGRHLHGLRAYVSVTGQHIASAQPISGDSFTVILPGALAPGFHEIRVDVSHLAKQTYFFEVTP